MKSQFSQTVWCFLALNVYVVMAIGCIGESGSPVDWFVALKAPKVRSSSNSLAQEGLAYIYTDATTSSMELSSNGIGDTNSAVGQTVSQILGSTNAGYLLYNDEPAKYQQFEPRTEDGHTKGVVGFDSNGGFWMVHSVPKFPVQETAYSYPEPETLYGQSFMCVSFKLADIDMVAHQLQLMHPHIYSKNMPDNLASQLPTMQELMDDHFSSVDTSIANITSAGGVNFVSFAKNGDWDQDLYANLVSTYFQSALVIETWMRPYTPSCCAPTCQFNNMNAAVLTFSSDIVFKEGSDHSKWAISYGGGDWVCIGGINRDATQYLRGGGTVCQQNSALWANFNTVITQIDSC